MTNRQEQTRREMGTQTRIFSRSLWIGSERIGRTLVAGGIEGQYRRGVVVKANLARFTVALSLLATMAVSGGISLVLS
jgi:hypothetical protein